MIDSVLSVQFTFRSYAFGLRRHCYCFASSVAFAIVGAASTSAAQQPLDCSHSFETIDRYSYPQRLSRWAWTDQKMELKHWFYL